MTREKTLKYSFDKSMDDAKTPKPLSKSNRREGTEGNNATQSEPDDSRHTSMLDSGKQSARSPYTAGSQ
jgi:hypothetical protein